MTVDVAGLQLTLRQLAITVGNAAMRVRLGDLAAAEILLNEAQRLALVCERECKVADPRGEKPSESRDG